jgi:hypothetical protein
VQQVCSERGWGHRWGSGLRWKKKRGSRRSPKTSVLIARPGTVDRAHHHEWANGRSAFRKNDRGFCQESPALARKHRPSCVLPPFFLGFEQCQRLKRKRKKKPLSHSPFAFSTKTASNTTAQN